MRVGAENGPGVQRKSRSSFYGVQVANGPGIKQSGAENFKKKALRNVSKLVS